MEVRKKNLLILVSLVVVFVLTLGAIVVSMAIIPNAKHDLTKLVPVKGIKSIAYIDLTQRDDTDNSRYYEYDLTEGEVQQFIEMIKDTKYRKDDDLASYLLHERNSWCYEVIYDNGEVVRFGNNCIIFSNVNKYYREYVVGDCYDFYGGFAKFTNSSPIEFNPETFHLQEIIEL